MVIAVVVLVELVGEGTVVLLVEGAVEVVLVVEALLGVEALLELVEDEPLLLLLLPPLDDAPCFGACLVDVEESSSVLLDDFDLLPAAKLSSSVSFGLTIDTRRDAPLVIVAV